MGEFKIYHNGRYLKSLFLREGFTIPPIRLPQKRTIYSTLLGDLYIAIGDKNSINNNESWTTRIWFNPFTNWIWIGVFLLSLGGVCL